MCQIMCECVVSCLACSLSLSPSPSAYSSCIHVNEKRYVQAGILEPAWVCMVSRCGTNSHCIIHHTHAHIFTTRRTYDLTPLPPHCYQIRRSCILLSGLVMSCLVCAVRGPRTTTSSSGWAPSWALPTPLTPAVSFSLTSPSLNCIRLSPQR